MRRLAEVTLTLVLFADASQIDVGALRREYAVPLRLLGIGLPLTILAGWALAARDPRSIKPRPLLPKRRPSETKKIAAVTGVRSRRRETTA